MKKLFTSAAIFIFTMNAFSQSGQKFASNGNILSTGEFLGSTNLFPLVIKTNNKEWFRITETGNVGIGTSTPIQTLDVNGRINVSKGVIQRGGSPITSTTDLGLYSLDKNYFMRFVTNGGSFRFSSDGDPKSTTPLFAIESNGNVGIGTANPQAKLEVDGNFRIKNTY